MKTFRFFALVGALSLFIVIQPTTAQLQFGEFQNYVVIGAFKYHQNAIRFTNHAHSDLHLNAQFEMNASRNLYYVYVLHTDDRTYAIREAQRLRAETKFTDTWVYSLAANNSEGIQESSSAGTDINPVTGQNIEQVEQRDVIESSSLVSSTEETKSNSGASQSQTTSLNSGAQEETNKVISSLDDGLEGKPFLFKLFRATNNEEVQGDVEVIDADRSRKMATYKGNAIVKVSDPASKSDNVSLVCEVFGYRKLQRDLNYVKPEGEGIVVDAQGAVEVPFELIRLQKGDVAIMYNVYFFKDASIMRPESRYEVGSLLDMLKENPNYKIRIHGHTNGGSPGKIISPAKNGTDYFSLTNTHDGYGSAKQLSEERALIIRDFLVTNGIDGNRMEIKAWGGKKPLFDKYSTRAQENVRVEIEILEN